MAALATSAPLKQSSGGYSLHVGARLHAQGIPWLLCSSQLDEKVPASPPFYTADLQAQGVHSLPQLVHSKQLAEPGFKPGPLERSVCSYSLCPLSPYSLSAASTETSSLCRLGLQGESSFKSTGFMPQLLGRNLTETPRERFACVPSLPARPLGGISLGTYPCRPSLTGPGTGSLPAGHSAAGTSWNCPGCVGDQETQPAVSRIDS